MALFRWDINIRESSVLGLVGAGGIEWHLIPHLTFSVDQGVVDLIIDFCDCHHRRDRRDSNSQTDSLRDMPEPLQRMPLRPRIQFLWFDIDDTFTSGGLVDADAF